MSPWQILQSIAEGMPGCVYVELGGAECVTARAVAKHASRTIVVDNDPHVAHSIQPPLEFYNVTTDAFFETIKMSLVIDLLFIDAWHSYEQVKIDFDNYSTLVKDQGIIILHDTYPTQPGHLLPHRCNDCWKFARDLRQDPEYRKNFEICTLPFYCGVSIVRKTDCQVPLCREEEFV